MSLFGFRSKPTSQQQKPVEDAKTPENPELFVHNVLIAATATTPKSAAQPIKTKQTATTATAPVVEPIKEKDETLSYAREYLAITSLAHAVSTANEDEKYPNSNMSFLSMIHKLDQKLFEGVEKTFFCIGLSKNQITFAQSLRAEFKKHTQLDGVRLQTSAINQVKPSLRAMYCDKFSTVIRIIPGRITWSDIDKTTPQTCRAAISYPSSFLDSGDYQINLLKDGKVYDYLTCLISAHSKETGRLSNVKYQNPTTGADVVKTVQISVQLLSVREKFGMHPIHYHHRQLQSLQEMAYLKTNPSSSSNISYGPSPNAEHNSSSSTKLVYETDNDTFKTLPSVNLKRHITLLMCMDWEQFVCEILWKHNEQTHQLFSDIKDREEKIKTVTVKFPESDLRIEEQLFQSYFLPLFHIYAKTPETADPNVLEVQKLIEFTRLFIALFNFRKNVVPLYDIMGECPITFSTYQSGQTQGMPLMGELTIQGITPDHGWFQPPVNK